MREEYSLTQDSGTWQVFELGRLRAINETLIFKLTYVIGFCSEKKREVIIMLNINRSFGKFFMRTIRLTILKRFEFT